MRRFVSNTPSLDANWRGHEAAGDIPLEKISWTLAGVQMVDFRENFRAGLRELLKIWDIELKSK